MLCRRQNLLKSCEPRELVVKSAARVWREPTASLDVYPNMAERQTKREFIMEREAEP